MAALNDWAVIDANNNAAPPDGWPENTMQYSEVNNTGRAVQGTLRRFFGDINGSLQAGGVADAYTVTLNESGYVAYFQGMYFACEIMVTNTGASTINVNGIGVQSVVDRAGNALAAGELQAGGIYEFRYDGTNFQLMGTLVGTATVASGIFTNSNAPDLVDTDVALNIGAADPTAAAHIEIGPGQIQAKADATSTNRLDVQSLGGLLNLGAQSGTGSVVAYNDGFQAFNTEAQGLSIQRGSGTSTLLDLEDELLNLEYRIISQQAGQVVHTAELPARGIRLSGRNTGDTADHIMIDGLPDGRVELRFNNDAVFVTTATGFDMNGALNNDPAAGGAQDVLLEMSNNGGTRAADLGFASGSDLTLRNRVHSGLLRLEGEDAAGTLTPILIGDPDDETTVYHSGLPSIVTTDGGAELHSETTSTTLLFLDQANATVGRVFVAASAMGVRSETDASVLNLQATDTGSTLQTIAALDPDLEGTGNHGITADRLRLTATDDASLVSTLHGLEVGDRAGLNVIMDGNEIVFRNNGVASNGNINVTGGGVTIGDTANEGAVIVGLTTVAVEHLGETVWQTRVDGINIRGNVNNALGGNQTARIQLETSTGVDIGFIGHFNTPDLHFRNQNHGGQIEIEAEDSGGNVRTILDADPDANTTLRGDVNVNIQVSAGVSAIVATGGDDVALFDNGTEVFRTLPAASGGAEANNTSTGAGFERVLTTSDLGSAGDFDFFGVLYNNLVINNTTTLSYPSEFVYTIEGDEPPGRAYFYEAKIIVQAASATPDLRLRWDHTGSVAHITDAHGTGTVTEGIQAGVPAAATITTFNCSLDVTETSIPIAAGAAGSPDTIHMFGVFSTTNNFPSGDVRLGFAQSTANASDTTILAGSYVRFKTVNA